MSPLDKGHSIDQGRIEYKHSENTTVAANAIPFVIPSSEYYSNSNASGGYTCAFVTQPVSVSNGVSTNINNENHYHSGIKTAPTLLYDGNLYPGAILNGNIYHQGAPLNPLNPSPYNSSNMVQVPTSVPIPVTQQIKIPVTVPIPNAHIARSNISALSPHILPTPGNNAHAVLEQNLLVPPISQMNTIGPLSAISSGPPYLSRSWSENGNIIATKNDKSEVVARKVPDFKEKASGRNVLQRQTHSCTSSPCIEHRNNSEISEHYDSMSSLTNIINVIISKKLNENTLNTHDVPEDSNLSIESSRFPDQSLVFDETQNTDDLKSETIALPSVVKTCPSFDSFGILPRDIKYLNEFYKNFTCMTFPLCSLSHLNPAKNIILNYAMNNKYLLLAVLACGAFQKWMQSHNVKDRDAYYKYLGNSQIILSSTSNSKGISTESLVLDILLMASFTPRKEVTHWKPHLSAVKKLLMQQKWNSTICTYVLEFCRTWYISICLSISIPFPYSDKDISSTDFRLSIPESVLSKRYLQSMKLIRKDGFNYIYGHTNKLCSIIQQIYEYARRINRWKYANSEFKPQITLLETNRILNELMKEHEYSIIGNDGISESFNKISLKTPSLPEGAVERIVLKNGTTTTVSWYDISQQSFVWSAIIILLSVIGELPSHHYMVQEAVHKILSLLVFMNAKEPLSNTLMFILERPVYVAAVNCITTDDRKLISKFFLQLHRMGHISAHIDLTDLYECWENKKHD